MLPFAAPIDFKQKPTDPILPLPSAPQATSALGQVLAGAYNGAVKPTAEFIESPAGFATAGLGAVPAAIQRGVSALFAPYAFKNAAEATGRFNDAYNDPNASLQDKVTPLADAVSQGLMGVGAARHAIPAPNLGRLDITAWHGSPHNFDQFSTAKIGEGEGNQAYGHGLYFAENPKVATEYQALGGHEIKLADGRTLNNFEAPTIPQTYALEALVKHNGDFDKAISELSHPDIPYNNASERQAALDHLQELQSTGVAGIAPAGNLYKVDLAPNHEDFLHWDKPLSGQTPQVAGKLPVSIVRNQEPSDSKWVAQLGEHIVNGFDTRKAGQEWLDTHPAYGLYDGLASLLGPRRASEYLNGLGIPGIAYLDQGSRGAGQGTHNYVMFDDKGIKILEKNGQPVSSLFQP